VESVQRWRNRAEYPWESAKSKATMRFRTVIKATGICNPDYVLDPPAPAPAVQSVRPVLPPSAVEIAPPVLPPAPTAKQDCDNPPYGADETRYRRFIDAFAAGLGAAAP
jgi:hypothetical protein